ncbi:MAG: GNAT family N-acetyltransferase [Caldilineaceae bacterium]|nr:GNAT family N-acetyltransferase [Caldilineaceae bacterium]
MTIIHDEISTIASNFILRPPTWDDLPAVIEMLNLCTQEMLGTQPFSEAMMRSDWTEPGFDVGQDCRLAVDGGAVVGYCAVYSSIPYVRCFLYTRTHPAHLGRGIGAALTGWGEERMAEKIPLAPPTARITVGTSNYHTHEPGAQLLRGLGYSCTRSSYEMMIEMTSAPPPPVWPEGITVRSMIPDQEEKAVYRALDESFRDHYGYVERPLEDGFARWIHFIHNHPAYDPNFFTLAMDGDQIAGFAICFPRDAEYPDMAWVEMLGVRRPWRRRGLALALLHHLFGECYQRGIPKVGLGVDASSLTGATRLYEKAGMSVYRQWDNYEKELRPGEDLVTRQVVN